MRRVSGCLVLTLVLCLALLLGGCTGGEKAPAEFRVGLLLNLSGTTQAISHRLAEAHVAALNAQGGLEVAGRKIPVRLILADTGGSIEKTMTAITQLIQQERVSAVIGPYYSREAIPAAAALESLRVPMISPTATSPEVTKGRTFAFRVGQPDGQQGGALAAYAYEKLGLRRVAVLYDESDAYSSGLSRFFGTAFAARPGASVVMEPYHAGEKDFHPHLARVVAAGAPALFMPNFREDLTAQVRQAKAAGFNGQFLGPDSWSSAHALHALPEAQGALFCSNYSAAAADQKLLAQAQTLADKAGVVLDQNGVLALDALDLLFTAAQNVGSTDPVSLRSGLAAIRQHQGISAVLDYSGGTGDPVRSIYLMGLEDGQITLRATLSPMGK
ncbi:ABC transporter substrate-binding protein [Humidesulfovibrio sp.]